MRAVDRIYNMFRPLDRSGVRRWIEAVNGKHSDAVMAARAAHSIVEEPGDAQLPNACAAGKVVAGAAVDPGAAAATADDDENDGSGDRLQHEIAAWVAEGYRGSEFRHVLSPCMQAVMVAWDVPMNVTQNAVQTSHAGMH